MVQHGFKARGVFTLALWLCAATLLAQPQLTTIEDSIFRADGTRFSGIALIEWRSFLASDYSSVSAYNKSVRVVDGVLKVNLVPTTTASAGAYYYVRYVVNGRVQSTEYWAVRPSTTPLKLRDIQLIGPPQPGSSANAPAGLDTVQITDVVGLSDELAGRAKKGIGYTPSRVAVINPSGDLEGAVGQPTDCVRANGTVGPCDVSAGPAFIDAEIPAGLINGTNTTFTLANTPSPENSLQLYRNGLLLRIGTDFTLTSNLITFSPSATPQVNDLLVAGYRLGTVGQSGGEAGGALTGYFPSPSVAPGAIADLHIASDAAIAESKLALTFPTHSNANDPTPEQKLALTGTSGTVSNANRFVTDQDPRLTNSRTPSGHALLGGAHMDVNPGVVSRGDLVIGQGTSPTLWSRLPLGPSNRCLISNGFDAVWNACLFTGFPLGSIPFVDASGNLGHNNSRLFWDNSARRMGIGVNVPTSTLTVHDSAVGTGSTTVTVRAGDGQGTAALERWQDATGSDVVSLDVTGLVTASAVKAVSSGSRPAWQETGTASDPSGATSGQFWYNTTEQARKSVEGSQTHTVAQVICSTAGAATSSTTPATLGSCRIPALSVRDGDRFEIRAQLSHDGNTAPFTYAVYWGSTALVTRSAAATESQVVAKCDALPQGNGLYWDIVNWGATTTMVSGSGMASNLPAGDVSIQVRGQMSSSTSEVINLRNLTVIRIPAQANP